VLQDKQWCTNDFGTLDSRWQKKKPTLESARYSADLAPLDISLFQKLTYPLKGTLFFSNLKKSIREERSCLRNL